MKQLFSFLIVIAFIPHNLIFSQSYFKKYGNGELGVEWYHGLFTSGDMLIASGSAKVSEKTIVKPRIRFFDNVTGDLIEQYTFFENDTSSYSLESFIFSDDIIYTTGVIREGGGTDNYDLFVGAFSIDDKVVWTTRIGEAGRFERGYGIVQDGEGNIIVVAQRAINVGGNHSNSLIVKLNKNNGDLLWQKYISGTAVQYGAVSVTSDHLNDIYLLAYNTSFIPTIEETGITKISSEGDSLWTKYYPIEGRSYPKEIQYSKDGNLIVAGDAIFEEHGGKAVPFFAKIDLEGEVLWVKEYRDYVGFRSYESRFKQYEDGRVAKVYDSFGYPTLMVIDEEGDVLFTREYDQLDVIFSRNLALLDDNSFAVIGYISSNLDPDKNTMWLFRTDPDGYLVNTNNIEAYVPEILIYPNPSSDRIKIKDVDNQLKGAIYKIYDASGRQVITTTETDIYLHQLEVGIYFITIISDNQLLKTLKFVKW